MKKLFLLTTIVAFAVPAFAGEARERWEGDRRMAVTTSITPLVVGAFSGGFGVDVGFEYAFTRSLSAKVNFRFINLDPFNFDFVDSEDSFRPRASQLRFNLEGRWYPQENFVQGLFLKGNLQFQRLSSSGSLSWDDEEMDTLINTFSAFAGLGYKAVFGSTRRHAFVMEPILDVGWRVVSDWAFVPPLGYILGTAGVRFRLLFGVAF